MKRTIFLATVAALVAMLVLVPMAMAQDTTMMEGTTVARRRRRPGERWPCHPSAGGRPASRSGILDLRDPEAQVVN